MRVLITGVTGMAGSHLAEYLLTEQDVELFACYRWRSKMENLDELQRAGKVTYIAEGGNIVSAKKLEEWIAADARSGHLNLIEGDMTDPQSMRRLIGGVRPDRIFHLAAQSYVPSSWNAPAQTLQTNVIGQVNIFEAVVDAGIDPLIHIAGSSEQYGFVRPDETPIKETNPLRPLSPYAVSKVGQEMLAYQYHRSYGLKTVVTRGFNHTGPRRGHVMVTSSFAKQIAEIEHGLAEPVIRVGDLTSRRDWTDVRDMVRAYWVALDHCTPGEVYNTGSGVAREVGEMLDILLKLSRVKVEVKVEENRLRPSDVKILHADVTKFQSATGWEPRIPFEQTLSDLLDYWRARVPRTC
ncbi:MAG: SDR family oxidoreductase [Chloroflexota bacterium]|nr:MAG: SDR family oxidoreductase [Chloroflexota bacterium]